MFILHVYITARSVTSAFVKIDARARVVIITAVYRQFDCAHTRSNYAVTNAMMIVDPVATHEAGVSAKCNVRNSTLIALCRVRINSTSEAARVRY